MPAKGKVKKFGGEMKEEKKGKADGNEDKVTGKPKGAQQINVRHILTFYTLTYLECEKHSKKEEALQKLESGTNFDDVARNFSEDKARVGGALGWKKRGDLDPSFEAVAFGLEASTTTNPKYAEVKTGFGYHIIMVEGRK
ncbi:Peptidyl-prolyl cis-trans isomerase PIN4 [Golovinomyces cichoracearum]|uniref:Peptidyl-prolyl cis-trans isomerase n=1 Tax=Golovinomyces cichoracearum TaxID=62708 RepID=A0A420INB2_9PEZI|nr:Peptidyl-prolyl cis-trans isomerase PIN4 [Golovinomyces cichoracearum]